MSTKASTPKPKTAKKAQKPQAKSVHSMPTRRSGGVNTKDMTKIISEAEKSKGKRSRLEETAVEGATFLTKKHKNASTSS